MIQHVGLEIRREDAGACLHFWSLLGFERVAAPAELAGRTAWVQAGETQIHLLFATQPVVAAEGHVAVVVADFERTFAVFEQAGLEPDARSRYWGSPRAFVRSPTGHRVEFMAFGPPS